MHQSPSRLAIYLRTIYDSGVDRVMMNLCHSFIKRGFEVDLVLNTVGEWGDLLPQFPSEVRIVDLKSPRLSRSLPDIMHYMRQEQPFALLAAGHYSTEMAVVAKHLSRVSTRIVVSEHSSISLDAKSASRFTSKHWIPLGARLLYPGADGIVAVSHGVARDLAHTTGLPLERIQVIYNPVFTPEILEKAKEPVEHPWFAPSQPPVILGVGRLEPQKDFPTLIRAFAQVRQVRPARLMILGKGGEQQKLNTLVHELGLEDDVAMPGFANNPYAYMARSAVFVLSSAWEGLANVLIEAMAVGTPVVSTDCESGPAEVLDNGKYGSLVPVGDSEALAKEILSVLSGNIRHVDPAWLDQFTPKAATEKYLAALGII